MKKVNNEKRQVILVKDSKHIPGKKDEEGQSPMRSVERVISILSLFAEERNGLGAQDIAVVTGIPQSTCFRMLRCLVDGGILEKSGTRYGVGSKILRMAQGGQMYERLRRISLPYLRKLSHETGQSVGMSIVDKDNFRICIELVHNAAQELRYHTPLRTPLPLHKGATGKMLWACLPEVRQLQVYRDNAMDMEESWEQISRLLGEIRHAGYFSSANERIQGACSVAAPVLSSEGDLTAVITVSAVRQQFTEKEIRLYISLLKNTCAEIAAVY